MKKIQTMLDLAIKSFNDKINKLYIFVHEMNPTFVFYYCKILQKSDPVNWLNQLETKNSKRLSTRGSSGIGLIENERIWCFISFSIKQYCIFF